MASGQIKPARTQKIVANWEKKILTVQSTSTLQVVVNPMLRRGSTIHDSAFDAVKELGASYVRYVPWLPYPQLAVAELKPPTPASTSWDFRLIDPMMADFMSATAGHSVIVNFSTIPQWMFKTPQPVAYPS
ncbi:MAG: glycosyl hydrolase family 39, partial [Acidobacteriota bacterium]